MNEPIFQLSHVEYEYPTGERALAGIDLTIARGQRLAALGANASGKSTLLQMLDGLCLPSGGEVKAFGKILDDDILHDAGFRRFFRGEVGMLFQNVDAQLFSATVEEDIAFGPLQLGLTLDETRARITDVSRMCEVEYLLGRPPYALSGGEKKRVALASILAVNPSVLLLDEPTAGLDPRTEVWLLDILDQLASAGKTLVIATHDLRFAADFADSVVALSEDHIIAAQGSPEDVLADYDLLLSINLIHAHTHRHGQLRHSHPHLHSLDHGHDHG
jgi:cobalt/nickel transport system ATP-binding protein